MANSVIVVMIVLISLLKIKVHFYYKTMKKMPKILIVMTIGNNKNNSSTKRWNKSFINPSASITYWIKNIPLTTPKLPVLR